MKPALGSHQRTVQGMNRQEYIDHHIRRLLALLRLRRTKAEMGIEDDFTWPETESNESIIHELMDNRHG